MKWRLTIIVSALLLTIPLASSGAQEARLLQRLDADTRMAVQVIVDSARMAGLPSRPLISKALEGRSKGASGERIIAAVRMLAAELGSARRALGPVSEPELEAAASALHLGVRESDLRALRQARGQQREAPGAELGLTVPLAVLADLVAYGVPADAAASAVMLLASEDPGRDEELLNFRRDVERDIALGAPPAVAAAIRINSGARTSDFGAAAQDPGFGARRPPPARKP